MLRIGRLFGVPIFMHFSFAVTVIIWCSTSLMQECTLESLGKVFAQIAIFLLSLFLHEYAHIGVARYYGFETSQVTISFFGFAALIPRLRAMSARQEFIVAVAGPVVSFLLVLLSQLLSEMYPVGLVGSMGRQASYLNAWITFLNLVPVLPLDGGRMFRSLLQKWFRKKRATYWVFRVSQVCALLGVVVAVTNGFYMLIAFSVFVWFASRKEYEDEYITV